MLAALLLVATVGLQDDYTVRGVIKKPTGNNGYEEYVQAAILLDRPESQALQAYVRYAAKRETFETPPPRPASVPDGASALDSCRVEARALKQAIELVRAGNAKPCIYPNLPIKADTLFPELTFFKRAAELIRDSAYVAFSDGNGAEGTALLLDGLTFSKRIAAAGAIHALASVRCERILLSALESHVGQLSLHDAERVAAWSAGTTNAFLQMANREREMLKATFYDYVQSPEQMLKEMEVPAKEASEVAAALRALTPQRRDYYYTTFFKRLEGNWQALQEILKKPEKAWLGPVPESDGLDALDMKPEEDGKSWPGSLSCFGCTRS